jgi:hypothetical protein
MKGAADFSKSSKNEEQYTPREWWERAITVMGEIDCDPASDVEGRIPARLHHSKKLGQDGLKQPWKGRTYLNPPYGPGVAAWFEKLWAEVVAGNCTEAIVLWKAALETEATRILIRNPLYRCSAVPHARISFLDGSGTQKRGAGEVATFTPIFHYFGPNEDKFVKVFSPVCTIWVPINNIQQMTFKVIT